MNKLLKHLKMRFCIFVILLMYSSCFFGQGEDKTIVTQEKINYKTELVVPELSIPWGMTWLPDGSMLITEIKGKLIHFKDGKKTEISNCPEVVARGQGGFLDIELHPQYKKNGWIYFTYSSPDGEEKGSNTALMRAKLIDGSLTEKELLYKGSPNTGRGHHFGSRIVFDDAGYVYFTIGDRGEHFVNPQDITKDGGKVYRLKDDGTIPADNPFYNNENAKKAIWSYGHRNQQGMVIHPETRQIWTHEHGPQGGDEINIIAKGKNYGWPTITYGINYDNSIITEKKEMEGMEQPLYYYIPSIAPSGMAFINSNKYPGWKGNLLIGSLRFQYLERLEIKNGKVAYREKLIPDMGRVRNVKMGPDGFIYAGVENKGIIKIVPSK
ncbi:MAG: PQQ-dependent sugar dehydrogenase [Saprospiraceae bacterium]|nr:PQQ-dependent sugar dehydrogenase [Saprospiraceae bacterium]